jgi:hypothetical protein
MGPVEKAQLTEASLRAYSETLIDPELVALRKRYCRTTTAALSTVSEWLTVDALLGDGDL